MPTLVISPFISQAENRDESAYGERTNGNALIRIHKLILKFSEF